MIGSYTAQRVGEDGVYAAAGVCVCPGITAHIRMEPGHCGKYAGAARTPHVDLIAEAQAEEIHSAELRSVETACPLPDKWPASAGKAGARPGHPVTARGLTSAPDQTVSHQSATHWIRFPSGTEHLPGSEWSLVPSLTPVPPLGKSRLARMPAPGSVYTC
ncbi:hypothetical protein AAFF_G00058380 [Aldrovandia affinis]|uniref:Uncharacterized protein n=1 Tax=Aldrovandia affinis TaxID=143900 RepID=A0AAD7S0D1_9TELE|nr:hypothetical protein AAFF_G00058380 [Aldrovandia affinis]